MAKKYLIVAFTLLVLSLEIHIGASSAPVITIVSTKPAKEGQSVTIECHAKGYPIANVSWYRNNVKLQGQNMVVNFLNLSMARHIFTAQSDSGGPYECRAINGMPDKNGTVIIKATLNLVIEGVSTTTSSTTAAPTKPTTSSSSSSTTTKSSTTAASTKSATSSSSTTTKSSTTAASTKPATSSSTSTTIKPTRPITHSPSSTPSLKTNNPKLTPSSTGFKTDCPWIFLAVISLLVCCLQA
ncbi:cell wall integrity and stress response component 3 isoform X2 [Exaiptasia diaphana]|uniref:Ig-like domain-containing protein n=1 Tax=Exaiptasia diaphana TaxID=2652724 RepID=A0A913X3E7_EXADI|nr:cell wall integrity and stress response component 3 isoform X2 [Exaiptasia diaphana]